MAVLIRVDRQVVLVQPKKLSCSSKCNGFYPGTSATAYGQAEANCICYTTVIKAQNKVCLELGKKGLHRWNLSWLPAYFFTNPDFCLKDSKNSWIVWSNWSKFSALQTLWSFCRFERYSIIFIKISFFLLWIIINQIRNIFIEVQQFLKMCSDS